MQNLELHRIPENPIDSEKGVVVGFGCRSFTAETLSMSSMNSTKRQRHESEYSLVTLSAVAAAKSIAESSKTTHGSPKSKNEVKKAAKSNSKNNDNQLHPMYGVQPFIAKLYQMISSSDRDTPYIAAWDDNGQTFVVKDTKAFASEIMPNYMQTKQFDSFIRNLNFYDFHKIHALPIPKSARDPGAAKHVKYRHPNFQRDKLDLVREIKRSTRKVRNAAAQQEKEVEQLKQKVRKLENTVASMGGKIAKFEIFMAQFTNTVNSTENVTSQKNTEEEPMIINDAWSKDVHKEKNLHIDIHSGEVNKNKVLKAPDNTTMPRTVSLDSNSSSSSAKSAASDSCESVSPNLAL